MLKISRAGETGQIFTLKLEGRVIGAWVNELRVVCESLLRNRRTLNLDLSDVCFADAGGVELLKDLKSRGVRLANVPPFVNEQLKATMARTE